MSSPVITVQPASTRVKIGEALALSLTATGTGTLTYQWQKDGVDLTGQTAHSLTILNFDYANEGVYSCIVTNGDGSTTSDDATVKSMPGQLDETYLQRKLYDWISTMLTLTSNPDTRAAGSVAMIWHMQDLPRFATPILMGRISAIEKIGRDAVFHPDNNGSKRQAGIREFMLYLQYFGAGAITALQKIADAVEDLAAIATLQEDGISPVWATPVLDAHQFVGTEPEDRAILDIRFRTTSEWNTVIDVIESAEATGEINETDEVIINS
jgi:hypothetical protein